MNSLLDRPLPGDLALPARSRVLKQAAFAVQTVNLEWFTSQMEGFTLVSVQATQAIAEATLASVEAAIDSVLCALTNAEVALTDVRWTMTIAGTALDGAESAGRDAIKPARKMLPNRSAFSYRHGAVSSSHYFSIPGSHGVSRARSEKEKYYGKERNRQNPPL